MISTKNLSLLPNRKALEAICKAISVLDAIICQEWQYRYYSFNSEWGINEQCLQMRNGSGEEMHILFLDNGCVINGSALEYKQQDKTKLTANLPSIFNEFIFGEPVASIGTTFCIWATEPKTWQVGQLENIEDNSGEMLSIFDGNPQTYVDWATDYFEGSYKSIGIPLETVSKIYSGHTLTKEMVLSIVEELEDWELLETDLKEINYPYNFE
ncbi:hypothetical protein OQX63_21775 [Pedobacter sp. PF22-3]|uniref:hypothetical protein n=1 Tax=Pedobacter sp. PF22-3 TaxID=2994467 RepID=UPI0022471A4D|nr:hypothetical protein [Pedobacter sp. PF22-3]MCX2496140.1 hypothetical protein [Pedobacter sp. PF22-3]